MHVGLALQRKQSLTDNLVNHLKQGVLRTALALLNDARVGLKSVFVVRDCITGFSGLNLVGAVGAGPLLLLNRLRIELGLFDNY